MPIATDHDLGGSAFNGSVTQSVGDVAVLDTRFNTHTAVSKLVKGIRAAGRLLAKHMPPWWNSIQDIFSGEAPSLLDALFGEDDRMREAVRRGDHKYANAEMRGQMINVMIDGWTGEADQECILVILKDADRRGDLRAVVRHVDGGRNTILWDLDGTEDRQARRLFRRHGIR